MFEYLFYLYLSFPDIPPFHYLYKHKRNFPFILPQFNQATPHSYLVFQSGEQVLRALVVTDFTINQGRQIANK